MDAARNFTPGANGCIWNDPEGRIFEWTLGKPAPTFRGQVFLTPIQALVRLADQRIYASAGPEIAHWYVLEGGSVLARDLGVPVSTLTTRRYGLQFSSLAVGPGGEIYAAENDFGGHLWIYFPQKKAPGLTARSLNPTNYA